MYGFVLLRTAAYCCALPAEDPWELQGLILRSTLLHLLRSRRGFLDPQAGSTLLARQQQQQQQQQQSQRPGSSSGNRGAAGGEGVGLNGSNGSGGSGSRGPGRAVLSNGSVDYAAATATQQLE